MSKNNLKQQAYQIIRSKIMNCEYPPGMLLNENIILTAVPGSRTPIRDAISRLEQERLVTILPKKGILVAGLSLRDLRAIYETRLQLEPFALLHHGNTLPESFYMEFYDFFLNMNIYDPGNPHYEFDDRFHNSLIEATGNPYFIQLYEQMRVQTHRARVLSGQITAGRLEMSRIEHLQILLSCLKKDWEAATANLKEHLYNSRFSVISELPPNHITL